MISPVWRLVPAGLLAAGLLVAGPAVTANAEPLTPESLLKTLDLRGYALPTAPPEFRGGTLDARQLSMTDHLGTVVVLNFWASWCLECRSEMLGLERLQREFSARGLAVIGVNARERREAVGRYCKELGLTFPLVVDPDGKIGGLYGVLGLPTTFVVGRDGRAIAVAVGPRQWDGAPARALIEALLAEPAPGASTR